MWRTYTFKKGQMKDKDVEKVLADLPEDPEVTASRPEAERDSSAKESVPHPGRVRRFRLTQAAQVSPLEKGTHAVLGAAHRADVSRP